MIITKKAKELCVGDHLVAAAPPGGWYFDRVVVGPLVLTACGAYAIPVKWSGGLLDTCYAYPDDNVYVEVIA